MEMFQQVSIYLAKTFMFRVALFFRHWYYDAFFAIYGLWLKSIRAGERHFAIRLNIRFLFQPLYQEYNIVGYILGFLYRFFKTLIGSIIYILLGVVAFCVYALWALVPVVLVYKIIIG